MNRQQAAHLLDAYVLLGELDLKKVDCAWESLRDVILDAMAGKDESNRWTLTYPPKPMVTYTNTGDVDTWGNSSTTAGLS